MLTRILIALRLKKPKTKPAHRLATDVRSYVAVARPAPKVSAPAPRTVPQPVRRVYADAPSPAPSPAPVVEHHHHYWPTSGTAPAYDSEPARHHFISGGGGDFGGAGATASWDAPSPCPSPSYDSGSSYSSSDSSSCSSDSGSSSSSSD